MNTGFVRALLDFLITPLGIGTVLFSLALVASAQRNRRAGWFLFTLCCFAASLGKFQNEYILQAPPLVFPLEQIRAAGRPLTAMLLVMLLLAGLQSRNNQRRRLLPPPIKYILLVQAAIVLKTFYYGSISFALLTAVTIGGIILMVYLGPSRWLQTDHDFTLAAWSVAMVGVVFIGVNFYQALYDTYPLTFISGRFLGTTGNPQAAALVLAGVFPASLYMAEHRVHRSRTRRLWSVIPLLVLLTLLATGSRTGLVMAIITVVFFYRQRYDKLLRFIALIGLCGLLLLFFVNKTSSLWEFFISPTQSRASSVWDNTRQTVWLSLWNSFAANPILGVPLQGDRFMGYGESSWLGAAAALGLLGLIPLTLFAIHSLRLILQLHRRSMSAPGEFLECSTVIAGLASLFAGSLFEAYLLGNLTVSVLLMYLYLVLGQFILETESIPASANSQPGQPSARALARALMTRRHPTYPRISSRQ